MFGRLLGWYTLAYIIHFPGLNFARCDILFAFNSCALLFWQRYCTVLYYWASAKLCGVEQRAPPIFGRAAITLDIGPHSSIYGCVTMFSIAVNTNLHRPSLPCCKKCGTQVYCYYVCPGQAIIFFIFALWFLSSSFFYLFSFLA